MTPEEMLKNLEITQNFVSQMRLWINHPEIDGHTKLLLVQAIEKQYESLNKKPA